MMKPGEKTIEKTLWSETLIEMLIVALIAKKSDETIKGLLDECKEKGFKRSYLIEKIRKDVGESSGKKVKDLL